MSAPIQFTTLLDKKSINTRITRGTMVTGQATKSPLYALPEVKASADGVIADTVKLQAAIDANNAARGAYKKSRTALVVAVRVWDGSYDILLSAGEKHCITDDDAAGLALPVRARTRNPLAMPLKVDVTMDLRKDLLRIHVHRAPGMKTTSVEVSNTPSDPASWWELDGAGARHTIPHPTPGEWQVRAASRTAKGKSDYTTPVGLIVK